MEFSSLELECNLMGLKTEDEGRKMKDVDELMTRIVISRALKIES